ncbi:MAG TPA: inosine/xanthosine triphosphatase [Candidatus Paceibacterota bacterium]|nr:inosine/xanthosine triphosphatase [Candidatus Paceibacterota bacterium]
MKKIIVASQNPVKINAALGGFQKMFPDEQFEVEGVLVPSGVSAQPQSDAETFSGAHNRIENACQEVPHADFWVGIEGGIEERDTGMEVFAWVVVKSKDGILGKARTSTFFLPRKIVELVKQGKELGEADDIVFGRTNSKQQNGAVGILTDNAIDRTKYYTEAVILSLIPFKNKELY